MLSWIVLRKPTAKQIRLRVQRDRQTGIPGRTLALTRTPTGEELETWAIQIGHHPTNYIRAWERLAEEAQSPEEACQEVV